MKLSLNKHDLYPPYKEGYLNGLRDGLEFVFSQITNCSVKTLDKQKREDLNSKKVEDPLITVMRDTLSL